MILLVFFWYSWKLSQHTLALYMASSPDKKQTVRPGEPLLTSPSMPGQKIRKMLTDVVSRCHQNDQKKSNLVCPPARAFAFAQFEPTIMIYDENNCHRSGFCAALEEYGAGQAKETQTKMIPTENFTQSCFIVLGMGGKNHRDGMKHQNLETVSHYII